MQYAFATYYVQNGFNAYQAAIDAGYSENYARVKIHALIKHPAIQEQLAQVRETQVRKLSQEFQWKVGKLKRIINAFIPDDTEIALKPGETKVAVSAMIELNKMHGDYAPDKRLSLTVDMTKDKLLEAKRQYEEF